MGVQRGVEFENIEDVNKKKKRLMLMDQIQNAIHVTSSKIGRLLDNKSDYLSQYQIDLSEYSANYPIMINLLYRSG